MIHTQLDGQQATTIQATIVSLKALNTVIGPTETVMGTPNLATKLADLSTATAEQGFVVVNNRSSFSIFWGIGTPSGSSLTTSNGVELPANSFVTLDNIAGLCVWAVSGTAQSAGTGTRVSGGFTI